MQPLRRHWPRVQRRYRGVGRFLCYRLLYPALARLPLRLAYGPVTGLGYWRCWRDAYARSVVAQQLQRQFPLQVTNRPLLQRWLRHFFGMMARESFDTYVMSRLVAARRRALGEGECTPWQPPRWGLQWARLSTESLALYRQARGEGRGVIIVMAHYGRVNMLLLALALRGARLGMLTMPVDDQTLAQYPALDRWERQHIQRKVYTLLALIGGPLITTGDDLRRLYRALAAGETLVILLDVPPQPAQSSRPVPFMGGVLTVPTGIERLAKRTGAALLYGVARDCGWFVESELRPLSASPAAALARRESPLWLGCAAAELERDVKAKPWQWWQWPALPALWSADGAAKIDS